MSSDTLLARGKAALLKADWAEARRLLEQAAEEAPDGETLEALGKACWWQDDGKAVLQVREAAYRHYRDAGNLRGAGRLATLLGVDYWDYRGDFAVADGWFQRAESLLAGIPLSEDHGWLHIYCGYAALV